MAYKPYRVDFDFTYTDKASVVIAAETPEQAKEAAPGLIPPDYQGVVVTNVEEYTQPKQPVFN